MLLQPSDAGGEKQDIFFPRGTNKKCAYGQINLLFTANDIRYSVLKMLVFFGQDVMQRDKIKNAAPQGMSRI